MVSQLAVLSLEGQEQRIIDLEPYYPLDYSPFLESVIPDRQGGVYLLLMAGLVHLDTDFRPIFLGNSMLALEDAEMGWDGNFYTYESQGDYVRKWGSDNRTIMHDSPLATMEKVISATQLESPAYTHLIGADARGQLYFRTHSKGRMWLVRVSASGDKRAIAAVPEEWSSLSTVGPDGVLYGLGYNLEDQSTGPRIIQCALLPDQ